MPEQQVPRQRGTRARRRSRGRGRVAGRATSTRAIQQKGGQRGRRVQRGQIRFAEGEADRLRNLQEERKRKANVRVITSYKSLKNWKNMAFSSLGKGHKSQNWYKNP